MPSSRIVLLVTIVLACFAANGSAGASHPGAATAFPQSAVVLLPGPMLDAQERDRAYLRSLDPDRLLHNFRVNAGLPSSAEPLGGWEKPDCELRGHFVGHYLTACALMYEVTGDTVLRGEAQKVVRGLDQCQRAIGASGYLSAFPEELMDRLEAGKRVWAPWYTLHKIYQGLLDMDIRCNDTLALSVLRKTLSWVKRRTNRLDDAKLQATLGVEFGGMGEVLANAYRLTRDPDHLALAKRFDKRSFTDPLAQRTDKLKGLHANTHIPQAIAAARLFEVTGEQRYGEIAGYFWDEVVSRRSYVTGGTSDYEHWRTDPGMLAGELGDETHENCCTYNMLRLTRILQTWTPDPARGDYYERALYNGILPTQHPVDGGGLMYFVPMRSGHFKMFSVADSSYWCCDGSGIESFATLTAGAFYHDSTGVVVDLFLPSRLSWKEKGVSILTDTRYPEEETVRFRIQARRNTSFALRIRVPGWVEGKPSWWLNGTPADVDAQPGTYAKIERTWHDGDSLVVRFPMGARLVPLPGDPKTVSVMYGPVVLAGELGVEGLSEGMKNGLGYPEVDRMFGEGAAMQCPAIVPPSNDARSWIVPVPGRPLVFRTLGVGKPHDLTLIPFYRLFGERYALYFRTWTPDEWVSIANARAGFPTGLVDSVRVGDPIAEDGHNFQAWKFTRGETAGTSWVTSPQWLRYDMDLPPNSGGRIRLTVGAADTVTFDILLDGVPYTTVALRPAASGGVRSVTIPIDPKAVPGRSRVAVMLKSPAGVPHLYGCAVVRAD